MWNRANFHRRVVSNAWILPIAIGTALFSSASHAQPDGLVPWMQEPPVERHIPEPRPATTNAAACDIRVPMAPVNMGTGRVTMFLTPDMVAANVAAAQIIAHGSIDPDYLGRMVVRVHLDSGLDQAGRVPPGLPLTVGDRVILQSWYRNWGLPCNYVPNVLTGDLGPADPEAPGGRP